MSASSPVFEELLNSENEIPISDYSYDEVKLVVDYCYGSDISRNLRISEACSLLAFAEKYKMFQLKVSLEIGTC